MITVGSYFMFQNLFLFCFEGGVWLISSFHFHSSLESKKIPIYENNELVLLSSLFGIHLALISQAFQGIHQVVVLSLTAQHRGCEQSTQQLGQGKAHLTRVFIFKF